MKDPAPFLFGIVSIAVGIGVGFLMYAFPEGLHRNWPIWMAMLAPASFVLAGLHLIAPGLGSYRFLRVTTSLLVLCLLVVANWAALFSTDMKCSGTLSFLGVGILTSTLSNDECRDSLRVIMAGVDALVILPFMVFAWRKVQKGPDKLVK